MFLRRRSITPLTDEDLAARLRAGDGAPLGVLWDRYAHLLFGVAVKYLKDTEAAKDAVMGLFAELAGLLVRHEVKTFRPWVHTVMRNRCLMALRKKDPYVQLDPADLPHDGPDDDRVLHEASLQALETAIHQLAHGQQACIRSFYLHRNSYEEVAAQTGFSVEQVRSHLQNGRRNLRKILQRHGHAQ